MNGFVCVAAMQHLDKLKLWGKNIKCSPSKHTMVQLPKEGQPVSTSPPLNSQTFLVLLCCHVDDLWHQFTNVLMSSYAWFCSLNFMLLLDSDLVI